MSNYTKPFGIKSQSDLLNPDKTQHAATYDVLSEGEIEGLANGLSSVFINDVPIIDIAAQEITKNRNFTVNTTANNSGITNSEFGVIDALQNNNVVGLNLGRRHVWIEKAGKKGTGIASGSAGGYKITTSSSFFTQALIDSLTGNVLPGFVRITGGGPAGGEHVSSATFVSATEILLTSPLVGSVSNVDIYIDLVTFITGISTNTATLNTAPAVSLTATNVTVSGAQISETRLKNLFNVENLQFGLKTGTLEQGPLVMDTDFGQASVISSPNIELEQNNLRANVGTTGNLVVGYNNELDEPSQPEGTAADTLLTAAFLDVSNPSEVDEVHLTFNLPACHALKSSSGAKGPSFVELQIFFEYSTDGGSSFISRQAFGPTNSDIILRNGRGGRDVNFPTKDFPFVNNGYIKPRRQQLSNFVEEFVINTEQFQPYDDWRIRIRRITDLNFKDRSFQHTNPCTLSTVESIVKDKLTYPHTAYAFTSFNAKDYDGQVPTRSFTLKGVKIQVPTNYRTREETGGAAAYTRNVTTGATESSYQNWDGNFRGDKTTFNASSPNFEKVFCDNPVWVFFDMLTNERYGMGQFIDKSQIDIYELFRLAKYCDEEVSDGEGGVEPRFTTNVYLTKTNEATNVLKQLASVMGWFYISSNIAEPADI